MSASDNVLEVRNLAIRLPDGGDRAFAVQDISFDVGAGETLCLVGESGSGKSTIAKAVMGLLQQTRLEIVEGTIMLGDQDLLLRSESERRTLYGHKASMIFQEPMSALNPLMKVKTQIKEGLWAHRRKHRDDDRRTLEILEEVGLQQPAVVSEKYPVELSGGQRQRVMIGSAVTWKPDLIIADEPTTALDVTTQRRILELLAQIQRNMGTGILFITHDLAVVSEIGDRIIVMKDGRIVETGTADQVLRQPQEAYTRMLIESVPQGRASRSVTFEKSGVLLEVSHLTKTFRKRGIGNTATRNLVAVDDVSFQLHRGETLGIVGESGSGKSTLVKCLSGLDKFDSGQVTLAAEPPAVGNPATGRRDWPTFQMVFQDPYMSLNPRKTVLHSVTIGPMSHGIGKQEATEAALELLGLVELEPEVAYRYPSELSGGQRQRVGIARALALQPRILIADEAVSALDVSVQATVLQLLRKIRDTTGIAIIFITHDLMVAGEICDTVIVMKNGQVVETGQASTVLGSPVNEYTRILVEAAPRML